MRPFLNFSGCGWVVNEVTSGEKRKWEVGCSGRQWDEVEGRKGSRESQEGGIRGGGASGAASMANSPRPSLRLCIKPTLRGWSP